MWLGCEILDIRLELYLPYLHPPNRPTERSNSLYATRRFGLSPPEFASEERQPCILTTVCWVLNGTHL